MVTKKINIQNKIKLKYFFKKKNNKGYRRKGDKKLEKSDFNNPLNPQFSLGDLAGIVLDMDNYCMGSTLNGKWGGWHFEFSFNRGYSVHFMCCIANTAAFRIRRYICGEQNINNYLEKFNPNFSISRIRNIF